MAPRLSSLAPRQQFRPIVHGIAAFLCLAPCVPVLTQALTLISARVLTWGAEAALAVALPWLPVDPVYAHALIYNVGHIDPRGLAVAGPIGDVLHHVWPHAFETSDYVQGG